MSTLGAWLVALLILVGFVVALVRFQNAPDRSGRVIAGIAAPVLGIVGIVVLAALIF